MPKNKREFDHLTRTTRTGIEALAIEIKLGRKKKDGRRRSWQFVQAVHD